MKLTKLYNEFFKSEKKGGLILVFATTISLVLANSAWSEDYISLWQADLGGHSIIQWINDGLMAIFFLLIGLELEREFYCGELSDIKKASLPIVGAIGGMLVPAALYLLLNFGTETQAGAGIPMATDIALALGILSLLGNRVPVSLKIFLTALAVIDDLGAIIEITIFYSGTVVFSNLLIALGTFGILVVLNRLNVRNLIPYLVGGVAMWYFMLHSGVHATITGAMLAFAIPFGYCGEKSPSNILQHYLHKPVAFLILPLFAAANMCIPIGEGWQSSLVDANSLGIVLGLVVGKPLGIWLFSYIGVVLGFCALPSDLKWKNIVGAGFLGGIGFTMSIFIAILAFDDETIVNSSKIAIIIASILAGIIGLLVLRLTLKAQVDNNEGA